MTRTREVVTVGPLFSEALNTTCYEFSVHQTALIEGLNDLRQHGELLDVTLVVQGCMFRAHKVVLSACSDYFRAMFTDNMLESRLNVIKLDGMTPRGFGQVLDYAYTSRVKISCENVQDVLQAASYIHIEPVIQACTTYLMRQIDLDNCVDIATIADMYSLRKLRVLVYRHMSEHLLEFSKTKEFYRLTAQQLETLLAYDFPVDCSEAEVLRIVLAWFFHVDQSKLDFRISYAMKIIRHVHFEEISRRKLHSLLDKIFHLDHANCEPDLYKLIVNEAYNSSKTLTMANNKFGPSTLINSRGLELALLKVGGFGLNGITNEITYRFASDRKWRHLTTIPHLDQCNFGTAVLNNELYIIGGCFNQSLQENIHPFGFKYSPRFDKWSTMAPMKLERCRFSLNVVGGDALYAVGGVSEAGDAHERSRCEYYYPDYDSWFLFDDVPGYVTQHAGACYDRKLYISGGMDRDSVQSKMYCFVRDENVWQHRAPMLRPRADHVMIALEGYLYVCGGWAEEGPDNRSRVKVDTIDAYDVKNDCWEVVTRVPNPKFHAGIVCIDRKIYFIGGFDSDEMFDKSTAAAIDYYDIDHDMWNTEDRYPQNIWEHTCTALYIPKWRDDMEDMQVVSESESKT